jgi:hypothetical protein
MRKSVMIRAQWGIVGLTAALFVGWGCGSGTPPVSSSTEEVTVQGTVTVKGKPLTKGEITFDPSNINRRDAKLNTAKIGSDGTYTLKTLVGENTVRVGGPQVNKDPALATNQVIVDIKSGENTIPIDVQ